MEDKAVQILNKLNEISNENWYGGYVDKTLLAEIIREVMFERPGGWGDRFGRCSRIPFTTEQTRIILLVFQRMVSKGVIRFSKSGDMVKPLMTANEWNKRKLMKG